MLERLTAQVQEQQVLLDRIRGEIGKWIVGQKTLVDRLLIGLFCKGHILIEGVPGLAKTSAVRALAATIRAEFKRIQFTPDLLPADLLGTEIFVPQSGEFRVKRGPIFHHIILADEINRAPSKVQSALLEAMQERQVTIGETTFPLPDPFLVLATQNPIDQEGTYPLPEAQVDRFMFKLLIDYPSKSEEKAIMARVGFEQPEPIAAVLDPARLDEIGSLVRQVHVDEKLLDYLVDITLATRRPEQYRIDLGRYIQFGASPRATIYLSLAARAHAFLNGRAYVTPHDIKTIAPDVLRHRIIRTFEAEADDVTGDQIIARIFDSIEVP